MIAVLHRQFQAQYHLGLSLYCQSADTIKHLFFCIAEKHVIQLLARIGEIDTVTIKTLKLFVFFEIVMRVNNGVHGNDALAQRVAHHAGEFNFLVVVIHDAFQPAVDGGHLRQSHHRQ